MNQYDRYASREEIAADLARRKANGLQQRQKSKTTVKGWINENLDKMSDADIEFIYKMSAQVPEMRAFFKVFKGLQDAAD